MLNQMLQTTVLAAGRPHEIWYLLPLAIAICLVYSASRYEHPPRIISEAFWLFVKGMIFFAVVLAILFYLSIGL